MKNSSSVSKEQRVKELQAQVTALQSRMKKGQKGDEFLAYKIQKSTVRFRRISDPLKSDIGHGEFLIHLDITALSEAVYIPISIASGKKTTGFIYQIEGTGEGTISTTDISCEGDGVTSVTLGTLRYAKIVAGKTATFRILIEMRGKLAKTYTIVINRINYKFNPSEARYKRLDAEIRTKTLPFR